MAEVAEVERGVDFIICGLCRKSFRAISNTHLVRSHGFDAEHPIEDYKERFNVSSAECEETRERQIHSYQDTLERQGKRWTPARVVREIAGRAGRLEPLNAKTVVKCRQQLMLAARTFFGSWDAALAAAGVQAEQVRLRSRWTPETILERIRGLAGSGASLSYTACDAKESGLGQAARRAFGTWAGALQAAGLDASRVETRRRWTPERILEEIRRLDEKAGMLESASREKALVKAARRRWGSWEDAVAAAGRAPVSTSPSVRRWDSLRVLEEIRKRAEEGRSLQPRVVLSECGGLWSAARRRFGTWAEAVRTAGVEYSYRERHRAVRSIAQEGRESAPRNLGSWLADAPGVA